MAQEVAENAVCSADRRFRNAETGPCVGCNCSNDPPECTLYPGYRPNCCKQQGLTPHHVLPGHCFRNTPSAGGQNLGACQDYNYKDAPCICVKGGGKVLEHGEFHDQFDQAENRFRDVQQHPNHVKGSWTYEEASNAAAGAVHDVVDQCSPNCIKAQLDDYHLRKAPDGAGLSKTTLLRADASGQQFKTLPQGATPVGE